MSVLLEYEDLFFLTQNARVKLYLKAVLFPQNGAVNWSDNCAGVCTQIQTPHCKWN